MQVKSKYRRPLVYFLLFVAVTLLAGACAPVDKPDKEEAYLLIGKIEDVKGTIKTDKGVQDTVFRGQLTFKATPDKEGQLNIALIRLNLLSKGIETSRGHTGVIGLTLAEPLYPVKYSSEDGSLEAKSELTLHYTLIDKIKGYRTKPQDGDTNFIPFTEKMNGTLVGKFTDELRPDQGQASQFSGEMMFELEDEELGLVPIIRCVISLEFFWERLFDAAEVLKIQPVFIGTGASDPDLTGTSFDTLVRRAFDLWNRCGTERCIRLVVEPPMYMDNDNYRVLDNDAEASTLKDEVDVADAVEVFVVERMVDSMAVNWGGGGTYSSGTASAKIVSSDQNLDVPCPEHCTTLEGTSGSTAAMCARCGDTPRCGDVNYQHLSHELGHVVNLGHPANPDGLAATTVSSVMEPSGLCCDNPDVQSALNCRNASNPLLFWGLATCDENPDILD